MQIVKELAKHIERLEQKSANLEGALEVACKQLASAPCCDCPLDNKGTCPYVCGYGTCQGALLEYFKGGE